MSFWKRLRAQCRAILGRARVESELDAELRFHVEAHAEDLMRAGLSREEALRQARLKLGGLERTKEECRDALGVSAVESVIQDVRFGLRMLRKNPGFTAVAIVTLALGIGANTAIFSFTDQVLLRDLPVPHPERLVVLRSPGPTRGHCWSDIDDCAQSFSYPMYQDLRERATVFSGLLAYRQVDLNVSGHGATQTAHGELVSGNFFETLGVRPELGRVFTASDETAPGANPVAVLSDGYWARQFGADTSILNKPLIVNGVPLTVVGVARKGFFGVQIGSSPDIFIPVTMKQQMAPNMLQRLGDRDDHWLPLIGRLKTGISPDSAQAALQPIYVPMLESDANLLKLSGNDLKQFISKPLLLVSGAHGRLVLQQDAEEPLLVLTSMVGLVLLIACANLAGLLVARGETRRHEIAVRMATGASRGRLIRQLLAENLLIGIAGGAAGIALASWSLNALAGAIPGDIGAQGLQSALDFRVLWFAIGLTLLTNVLFGFAPAIGATHVDLHSTLKEQGSRASEGRSSIGLRKILIVTQVAFTAVLLAGAGLFARTLSNLEHADLGMNPNRVLQFSVAPDLNGDTPSETQEFAGRAVRRIAAIPGVRSVAISAIPIFSDEDSVFNITPEGYARRPGEDTDVQYDDVGPEYFSTMRIALMAGREFTEADSATSPKVCIVNAKLAQRFFSGRNPIGLHIGHGSGVNVRADIEIVGVVADSKWDSPRSAIAPFMYLPYSQDAHLGRLAFYVQTEHDPKHAAASLRSVIARLDPGLPVNDMRTLDEQVSNSMLNDKLVAALSVSLALLAALLAALGLYGVLAYVVARRTHEIGIRMALGGQRRSILRLVVGEGARLTIIGAAIGMVVALIATRWVASLLYGVNARDPLTFLGVVVMLALVSGAACYIPAQRAMRVDPMVALRHE